MRPPQNLHYHLSILLFISSLLFLLPNPLSSQNIEFKVGLIFDKSSPVGQIANTTIPLALDDFYRANPDYSTRISLIVRDSPSADIVASASTALELITQEKVQAILGPGTSAESTFVADIGTRAKVPIVSFSSTSTSVSHARSRFFIRAALNDSVQVGAIAALVKSFGWRRVVPIYEDNDYGSSVIPYLVDALDGVDTEIPYRCPISTSANDDQISAALTRLQTKQTRVFLVHMRVPLAVRMFTMANELGMMSDEYVWILSDGLTTLLSWLEAEMAPESMDGVLGVSTFFPIKDPPLHNFRKRWIPQFLKYHPQSDPTMTHELSNYAIWAYNAVWAIAMAAEQVQPINPSYVNFTSSKVGLSNMGVSSIGEKLLQAILNIQFQGLGGWFKFVDGELESSEFRIVNVISGRARDIGFYTSKYGLSRKRNPNNNSNSSTSQGSLRPVIWPNESTTQPKGFVTPTVGKKLRIAVPGPVNQSFRSFLDVQKDPVTNQISATGFVIEMFEAAVDKLPYALPFEYVQALNVHYNDLVEMVGNGTYDGAVADVTITARRSIDADFTLPYMASGLSMVVPVKNERTKNAWVFLRPLKYDLWLVSLAFFIFSGAVVWVLEHRINDEFRGPPSNQFGTVFYFIFSTLVFSHRERLVSNLSRFFIIVWLFVVLILQSSYTASLTSMLTVQRMNPTYSDIYELQKSGKNVGYLKDSFVKGFLSSMNFEESRLVPFKSPEAYQEALSNNSIAAIVDEIPYLQIFLKLYCNNYTMVGQTNKTGGFGFVFPKGSSLVSDLSRAILNITEGDESTEIYQKWFGDPSSCQAQDNSLSSSNSLDFISFWGLFLITGSTSIICCILHFVLFINQNKKSLKEIASGHSFRWKFRSMAKLHDQKDLSSHTFRKQQTNFNSPYNNPSGSSVSVSNRIFCEGSPQIGPPNQEIVETEVYIDNSTTETPNRAENDVEANNGG
ncbi:hypothetical protein LUZ60_002876 [Juncus effusus]|nr:hypothetical protein LUZ60_002876 [Juncus effusus]